MKTFTLIVAAVLLLVTGCAGRSAPDPGTITIALDIPPTNMDPRIGNDATSSRLQQLIFSSIVHTNERFEIEPDLAERWEIPDPLTYIFHLRTNARFHDGRPLTAKDIEYTFKTMLDGSIKTAKAGTYRLVQSIATPDDHTIIFKLKEPFAPFVWNLSQGAIGIIPVGSAATIAQKPIGSGPFKFVRHVQDAEVVIERNDDYYGAVPHVKTIRFKVIPEAIVRALELRKGSVDGAINVISPDMVEVLRDDKDLQVMTTGGTNYQYLAFNMQDPLFKDRRLRQAIAYAIDREKIIKYLLRGEARPAASIIPPDNWSYEGNVETYPYNPEKARQLLAEAGQPNLEFTFRCSSADEARMLAAVLQQQLKEVGIKMNIRSNEFATFFADVLKGNFQAYSLRWIGANNDPDMFNLVFHSAMFPPNGSNRGRYSNPVVDQLIDIGRRESDMDKRKEAYREIQKIVAHDLPYVSLWYMDTVAVFNKRVQGVKLHPAGSYEFLSAVTTSPAVAMR